MLSTVLSMGSAPMHSNCRADAGGSFGGQDERGEQWSIRTRSSSVEHATSDLSSPLRSDDSTPSRDIRHRSAARAAELSGQRWQQGNLAEQPSNVPDSLHHQVLH